MSTILFCQRVVVMVLEKGQGAVSWTRLSMTVKVYRFQPCELVVEVIVK